MGDNQLQSSFSVTLVFLNESDLKQELPISNQHQELTLQIHRELDDIGLTVNNGKQRSTRRSYTTNVIVSFGKNRMRHIYN